MCTVVTVSAANCWARGLLSYMCAYIGHYELDLSQPAHAAIASRLRDESASSPEGPNWLNLLHDMGRCGREMHDLTISTWRLHAARLERHARASAFAQLILCSSSSSSRGAHLYLRMRMLLVLLCSSCRKQPAGHGPPLDWRAAIPTSGTLSLDYVSTHPPGLGAVIGTWGSPAGAQQAPPLLTQPCPCEPASSARLRDVLVQQVRAVLCFAWPASQPALAPHHTPHQPLLPSWCSSA